MIYSYVTRSMYIIYQQGVCTEQVAQYIARWNSRWTHAAVDLLYVVL